MASINKFIFTGRVGQDPDRIGKIVKFSVATTDGWGDNAKTNWHACMVFGKQADFCMARVKKGMVVACVGKIDYGSKDDKTYTNVIIQDIEVLDWYGSSKNKKKPTPVAGDIDSSYEVGNDDSYDGDDGDGGDDDLPF